MTNYLIVLSKGRAGGGDGLQGEKRRGEQKGECLETLRFISSLLAPRAGLQGWVPLYVSLSPRRPPSLLFGSRWHLLLAWRVLPPPSEAGVPPTHTPACLPVQMLQSLGPACVESVRPVWCVMKRNRASHSGAQGAQGVEGWGWVPGKIGVGEVQGGRDVGIRLITISIRGRAQHRVWDVPAHEVRNLERRVIGRRKGEETRRGEEARK